MNRNLALFLLCALLIFPSLSSKAAEHEEQRDVRLWLTTADRSALFALQTTPLHFSESAEAPPEMAEASSEMKDTLPILDVNDMEQYQLMDGFGLALTGGSAQLLTRMQPGQRSSLLKELFSTQENGIGISYLRVSIGSSDMNDHVFSYDDLPEGQTDVDMAKFSLAPDRADVIPVLKEILAINPRIKILGSPWSAPAWMKTNDNVKGGHLKPEYYGAYAKYLVKYVEGMKAEGIMHRHHHNRERAFEPQEHAQHGRVRAGRGRLHRRVSRARISESGNPYQDTFVRSQSRRSIVSSFDPGRPRRQQVCGWHRLSPIWRRHRNSDEGP